MYCAVPTHVCALSTNYPMSAAQQGFVKVRTSCFQDLPCAKITNFCTVIIIEQEILRLKVAVKELRWCL